MRLLLRSKRFVSRLVSPMMYKLNGSFTYKQENIFQALIFCFSRVRVSSGPNQLKFRRATTRWQNRWMTCQKLLSTIVKVMKNMIRKSQAMLPHKSVVPIRIRLMQFPISSYHCSQVLLSWKFSKDLIGRLWKWRQHVFATAFTPKYKISLACFWLRRDSSFWQDSDLIRISVQSEPTAHSKRIKLPITGPAAWFYADEVCLASNESSIV